MKLKNLLVATALFAASATASAGEFYTYVPGVGTLDNDNFILGQSALVNVKFNSLSAPSAQAGLFQGYFSNVNIGDPNPADAFFRFFCVELGQGISLSQQQYMSSILSNDSIKKLFDVAFPRNGANDFWNGGKTNFGLFSSGASAAAFQVALWNLILDGDFSLTSGSFIWGGDASTDAIAIAAQNLLNQVNAYAGMHYQNWTLYLFTHPTETRTCSTAAPCFQDYLSATVVPEPATLALFGIGLVGLGAIGRRRRR